VPPPPPPPLFHLHEFLCFFWSQEDSHVSFVPSALSFSFFNVSYPAEPLASVFIVILPQTQPPIFFPGSPFDQAVIPIEHLQIRGHRSVPLGASPPSVLCLNPSAPPPPLSLLETSFKFFCFFFYPNPPQLCPCPKRLFSLPLLCFAGLLFFCTLTRPTSPSIPVVILLLQPLFSYYTFFFDRSFSPGLSHRLLPTPTCPTLFFCVFPPLFSPPTLSFCCL